MEVKPGYKQTEVGVIPQEWRVETIGKLIEERFILGHLDGNHGELYPRSHEFKPHGVPYIGANDFEEGTVSFDRCNFLTPARAKQFRKGVAKDGDVLFAHNATVGPVALLRTNKPFVILSTTATYFRCDSTRLDNLYLKAELQSEHFVRQYQAVMAQSTRFQVPITAQRKLSLVIPPLPEQRAIATALNDADALLGGLDRLITKKRDFKLAAMQELLTGQTRLPGFHGKWEMAAFSGVFRKLNAKNYQVKTSEYQSTGTFPVVDQGQQAVVGFSDREDKCFHCPKDGVVIFGDHTCIIKFVDFDFIVGADGTQILAAKVGQYARFHAFALQYRGIPTTGYNRHFKFLKERLFLSPPLAEQTAIAEMLTDMDAELAALERRREKTRALKQGMMQELLTGKTRLV